MRKTKSWMKSLLIVVLAMLLVVSLVACNKKPKPTPRPVTEEVGTDAYFNALWTASKQIGQTKINATDDLAMSLGAEIALNTRTADGNIYQQIDLGIEIQAVIGRTEATQTNTALKLRIYDPTDDQNEEIVTLYLFAKDIDNIYIDFAGKHVKLPHGVATLIWNDILGNAADNKLQNNIYSGLTNKFISIGAEKKSVNDIINYFIGDFGDGWSIDSLVNGVLNLFDFDVVGLINGLPALIKDTILGLFGVEDASELLVNGKLNVLQLLTNETIGQLFSCTKTTDGDSKYYDAKLDTKSLGLVGGMVEGLFDLLGDGDVALSFTEQNNRIKDFTLKVELGGAQSMQEDANGDIIAVTPEIAIKINRLKVETANEDNIVKLKENATYSEEIAISEKLELEAHGIKIGAIEGLTDSVISLNGKIIVDIKGKLDIVNKTNNKTQLAVKIDLINRDQPIKHIADASLAGNKIAVKLATPIVTTEETTKGFVYDLGANFNVATMFQNAIRNFVESMTKPNTVTGTPSADVNIIDIINNVCTTISNGAGSVLALIKTNNNVEVSTSNVLATIVNIKQAIDPETTWTESNRIEAIVKSLVNPVNSGKTLNECLEIITGELDRLNPDATPAVTWNDIKDNIGNALIQMLYICGSQLRLDGVKTEGLKASDYTKYRTDGQLSQTEMIYANHIIAVLGAQIDIKADLQAGIHFSASVKVADASLSVTSSLELVEITDGMFFDIYTQNKAEIEAVDSQWKSLNKAA